MYPEDRPRRSVRRESAGAAEEPKKKNGITLLAQVGVCAVLVLAAFLFKLSGNGAFSELQEQYVDAMSKQVTFEEAWAQVEEMADRYAVLAFFVEPIHSIQEAFSFQPPQGASSETSGVSGPDGLPVPLRVLPPLPPVLPPRRPPPPPHRAEMTGR